MIFICPQIRLCVFVLILLFFFFFFQFNVNVNYNDIWFSLLVFLVVVRMAVTFVPLN